MAIRTYKVTLDSKNAIAPEPVFLRQGDKTGAVVIDATLMDNGSPVSLRGLTPSFMANTADGQAVISDTSGFVIINASSGEFTYQVPSQLGSVPGKIKIAYFSFSDSSGAQSTFNVVFVVEKAADMTHESAKDWASNLNEIIDQYNQWANNAHSSWQDFVNENKEIIESIDPGGTLLTEVIDARKPALSDPFETLGQRLNRNDDKVENINQTALATQSNSLIVNTPSNFNKASLLFKVARRPEMAGGSTQAMMTDRLTGDVYVIDQNDDGTYQEILKYDKTSGELLQSRILGLGGVVWLEGNSLFHDPVSNAVCFVFPANLTGDWFVYDFDADTKGTPFKMDGQTIFCVDNSEQYFVNVDSFGKPGINGYITGLNVYDLPSVVAGAPVLKKYIPLKDSLVRDDNKVQGLQMIGNSIYFGRGANTQWFRTTVVDISGAIIADYNWDKSSIIGVLNAPENNRIMSIESEGVSWIDSPDGPVPVLSVLVFDNNETYAMIRLNDRNGVDLKYSSGVSVTGLMRNDNTGVLKGTNIVLGGADDESLLKRLLRAREKGLYTFAVLAGNEGLSPNMASSTGFAIVRDIGADLIPIKMMAVAVDYRNKLWTSYYDNGQWSRWSKSDGGVPLWSGSSEALTPLTLRVPVTDYSQIWVRYRDANGNPETAIGDSSGVRLQNRNVGDALTTAAARFDEANLIFTTSTTAQLVVKNAVSITATGDNKANGPANISVVPVAQFVILEIKGLV